MTDDKKKERSRVWSLTIWEEDKMKAFMKVDATYKIAAPEVCPTTGKEHWQSCVIFPTQRTFFKKGSKFGHIEKAEGTPREMVGYCKKGDRGKPYDQYADEPHENEIGKVPSGQGKRNDIQMVKDVVKETAKMSEVMEVATSYQSAKFGELYLKYNEPARGYKSREVFWYWGATGTGKTHKARAEAGDDYFIPTTYKWWDAYDGQKSVILDDIRGDFCKYHEILKLTGELPFRVETKGGSRQAVYDKIFITSAYPPEELWLTIEDKAQLLDRITVIEEFQGESYRKKMKSSENDSEVNDS